MSIGLSFFHENLEFGALQESAYLSEAVPPEEELPMAIAALQAVMGKDLGPTVFDAGGWSAEGTSQHRSLLH